MMKRKYFTINEQQAKTAKGMWSFSDYVIGTETEAYKKKVDEIYNLAERVIKEKPDQEERVIRIIERFAKNYAENINRSFSIEIMCPSVMISGASNFPIRKKEKQNSARDRNLERYKEIMSAFDKLNNILYSKEIIKNNDSEAIEKLKSKLESLETYQKTMKEANAFYKKNGTLNGFAGLTQENIDSIMEYLSRVSYASRPFEAFALTNNNAKIRATKERIALLEKAKSVPTQISDTLRCDICKVIENTELMRIQLIFDSKPDEKIRTILKTNGFKWAPSQNAWQRQLTQNAKYSTEKVMEQLNNLKISI